MRLVGTTVVCVVAAFGAAFLVARAIDHQSPARTGSTTTDRTTGAAVAAVPRTVNRELVAQFTPASATAKLKPKPRKRHVVHHPALAPSAASTVTTAPAVPTETTPTYTVITSPAAARAPRPSAAADARCPPVRRPALLAKLLRGHRGGGQGPLGQQQPLLVLRRRFEPEAGEQDPQMALDR